MQEEIEKLQEKIKELQEELKDKNSRIMLLQCENRRLDTSLDTCNKQVEIYEMVIKKLCRENDSEDYTE